MAVTAKLYRQERVVARYPSELGSTVRQGGEPLDAVVLDISTHGFSIKPDGGLKVGDEISIGLSGIGTRAARIVWRETDRFGCEFKHPILHSEVVRAFSALTVVAGEFAAPIVAAPPATLEFAPEPVIERWPVRTRVTIILGASAALWSALIAGARALIA